MQACPKTADILYTKWAEVTAKGITNYAELLFGMGLF